MGSNAVRLDAEDGNDGALLLVVVAGGKAFALLGRLRCRTRMQPVVGVSWDGASFVAVNASSSQRHSTTA